MQTFKRKNVLINYLLLAIFLLQPILTYLVTPHFERDSHGILVEICTLEGERQFILNLDDIDSSSQLTSNERCGAIELFKFSSVFYTPDFDVTPGLSFFSIYDIPAEDISLDSQLFEHVYSARAPPIIS